MASAPVTGQGVFTASVMAGGAHVALPIPRLVCVKVVELLRPALRHGSTVTVAGIKAVVHVAVKAARSVKPGAGPDKDAS
jgi:hypothetical protein